jgi:hypothetical protein
VRASTSVPVRQSASATSITRRRWIYTPARCSHMRIVRSHDIALVSMHARPTTPVGPFRSTGACGRRVTRGCWCMHRTTRTDDRVSMCSGPPSKPVPCWRLVVAVGGEEWSTTVQTDELAPCDELSACGCAHPTDTNRTWYGVRSRGGSMGNEIVLDARSQEDTGGEANETGQLTVANCGVLAQHRWRSALLFVS